jgi:hypothetical protein
LRIDTLCRQGKKVRQYLDNSSLSAAVVVIKLGGMFGLLLTVSRRKPDESNRAERNETVALHKIRLVKMAW